MNKELILSVLEEEYEDVESEYFEQIAYDYTEESVENLQTEMTLIGELVDLIKARYKK